MGDDGMTREPMLEVYLFEATQLMEQLEEIIIECEKNKKLSGDAINEIFRIMHTIKSSSAMMMFNDISVLAHSLEDLFYFIRENKHITVDFDTLYDLVLSGVDFIKAEVSKIQDGKDADGSSSSLVEKDRDYLENMKKVNQVNSDAAPPVVKEKSKYYISSYQSTSQKPQFKYAARIFYEDGCEMENVRAYTVVHNLKETASEIYHVPEDIIENTNSVEEIQKNGFRLYFSTELDKEKVYDKLNATIFLKSLDLEELQEYPEEIKKRITKEKDNTDEICACTDSVKETDILVKEPEIKEEDHANNSKPQSIISVNVSKLDMLLNLVGEIVISEAMVTKNPDLNGLTLNNFNKASRQLTKLTNELQDIVMSIRMVPVSMTFHKMNRIVRDMSRKLNKEVELKIIGEDTEVDKNIIDHISDPLMHLVRNCIDHGLEEKQERIKLGKSEVGTVTLEAKNEGSDVYIIVSDDGKGLDRKKIYEKAKEHGLVTKPESELTDKEIFSYILLPGFSTNENVTEYSGRGVGMDVVKKNTDSVGGSITIESSQGIGTSVYIKIPLTLAIIDGMETAVGKAKYTIPITSIKESFKAKEHDIIADSDGNEMIMIRGGCYPVLRLHKIFNIDTQVTNLTDGIMVMVETDTKSACLFADELIGEQQVVVKALPGYLKKVKGIAGCTILGDGNISLIIDINGILEM